jgi:hypothetical protein
MKLELKHLSGYLPYQLNVLTNSIIREMVYDLSKDVTGSKHTSIANILNGIGHKPILRPLSDLTKEIEVGGDKFVPLYKLCKMQGFSMSNNWEYSFNTEFNIVAMMKSEDWIFRYMNTEKSFWLNGISDFNKKHQKSQKQLQMFEKLYEWHFDIYNLIPNNLAIDKNTLK